MGWVKAERNRRFPLQPVSLDKVGIENLEHESRKHNLILLSVPSVLHKKLSKIFSTSFSNSKKKKKPIKPPFHTHLRKKKKQIGLKIKMKSRARNIINRLITSGEKKGLFCNFTGWEGFKC